MTRFPPSFGMMLVTVPLKGNSAVPPPVMRFISESQDAEILKTLFAPPTLSIWLVLCPSIRKSDSWAREPWFERFISSRRLR